MTLLTTVNDVCAAVGVHQTTSVVANINANRTMFEMLALANEMAQRIAYDMREWTKLVKVVTYTVADATLEANNQQAFALPADYKRMLLTGNVWRTTSSLQPAIFISDYDQWLQRRIANHVHGPGEWIITSGNFHFAPPLTPGISVYFNYLQKNCITLASGGAGDRFMADGDTFSLDERILKLGMIWQWKAAKGSPYAEDMGTWGDAMANAMGADRPGPIIIDRMPISASARTAYPWPVPTP